MVVIINHFASTPVPFFIFFFQLKGGFFCWTHVSIKFSLAATGGFLHIVGGFRLRDKFIKINLIKYLYVYVYHGGLHAGFMF